MFINSENTGYALISGSGGFRNTDIFLYTFSASSGAILGKYVINGSLNSPLVPSIAGNLDLPLVSSGSSGLISAGSNSQQYIGLKTQNGAVYGFGRYGSLLADQFNDPASWLQLECATVANPASACHFGALHSQGQYALLSGIIVDKQADKTYSANHLAASGQLKWDHLIEIGDSSVSLTSIHVPVANNLRTNCAFIVHQHPAQQQILLQKLTMGAGIDLLPTLSEAFYVGSTGVQYEVK